MNVLLDSSFILSSIQLGLDALRMIEDRLDVKLQPLVLSETIKELKRISARGGKRGREAQLGLRIVEKYQVMSWKQRTAGVDEAIVQAAESLGCVVATNDMRLRRKLRSAGVAVAFLHKDKRLEVDGWSRLQ